MDTGKILMSHRRIMRFSIIDQDLTTSMGHRYSGMNGSVQFRTVRTVRITKTVGKQGELGVRAMYHMQQQAQNDTVHSGWLQLHVICGAGCKKLLLTAHTDKKACERGTAGKFEVSKSSFSISVSIGTVTQIY